MSGKRRRSTIALSVALACFLAAPSAGAAGAVGKQCEELIRNPEKANFPPYEIGGTVFKIPFARIPWFESAPYKAKTINLFYSLDDQRFLDRKEDRERFKCRGWCDHLSVSISASHRKSNVKYRIDAVDKLSRNIAVADEYMVAHFRTLQDKEATSYWKTFPDRKAELRCWTMTVPYPGCEADLDLSPWVEIHMSFGRKYLPEFEKILDNTIQILNCLKEQ